ncbi:MAG: metallophosphoesterase, partial [Bacteroidetes bacterium]|nr:metallophosphoesterase [Bacteroidota bacterium]
MRILIFILLLLVFDFYAFQALRTLAQSWQPMFRNLAYGLYWLIPLGFIAWIGIGVADWNDDWSKSTVTLLRTFFFITYISKLLVVGVLLVDDLRRLGVLVYQQFADDASYRPGRSHFLTQLGLFLGAIPFFSLLYGVWRNPYRYQLFREQVKLANLPAALDGLKIVQISDIHSGSFLHKEPIVNAVDLINAQQPDLVFFTGDLVNNKAEEA